MKISTKNKKIKNRMSYFLSQSKVTLWHLSLVHVLQAKLQTNNVSTLMNLSAIKQHETSTKEDPCGVDY